MRQLIRTEEVTANIRECWVAAHNLRMSAQVPDWTHTPVLRAVVIETVEVPAERRRQGVCRRLIEAACADERFDIVIVEGVGNPELAQALLRWGWDFDPGVMDFYWRRALPTD